MPPPRVSRPLTEEELKSVPKITKEFIFRIFSYIKPYRLTVIAVSLLIVLSTYMGIQPSLLISKIVDDGILGNDFSVIIRLGILSLLVVAASAGLMVLINYLTVWVSQHIVRDMRNEMFGHMLKLPQSFFTVRKQGELVTRMNSDISGVQQVVAELFTGTFTDLLTVIVSLVTLFRLNWQMALLSLAIAPAIVIPTQVVGRKRWKYAALRQEESDKENQIITEDFSVSGQQLIKLFTKENDEYRKFASVNGRNTELSIREAYIGRWLGAIMRMMRGFIPVVIYGLGGYLLIEKGMVAVTLGSISAIVTLVTRLYSPIESLMSTHVNVTRSFALFSRIFEYLDVKPSIDDPKVAVLPKTASSEIVFDHVNFAYTDVKLNLKDICFTVPEGKTIALVGPSGAGKTTISSLIPRIYDVKDGRILFGNVDIRDMPLSYLRKQIGVVTQETYLFNDTLRENLMFANPEATEKEMTEACKKANIHDFICTLPRGYDTLVGARGFKLSGGERQRISIARMILKNPKVLIMDEATSSLDSISEKKIQDAIQPLLKGRTSLVIAHRLSTIMQADEIIVLQQGSIVQRGTHSELLSQGGIYKELYETQFLKNGMSI